MYSDDFTWTDEESDCMVMYPQSLHTEQPPAKTKKPRTPRKPRPPKKPPTADSPKEE